MFRRFVLSVFAVLCLASSASASTLFANNRFFSSVRGSDYGTVGGNGFRTYDDFQLGTGALVQGFSWDMFFLDTSNPVPDPAPASDASQWKLSFYADNAGIPGTLLADYTFAPADLTSTFLESFVFNIGGSFNVSSYKYAVSLPTALLLQSGTPYWVSVFALSAQYSPIAAWMAGGDPSAGSSFQQQLGAGMSVINSGSVARDRAFALEGTPVPEPATLVLVGVPVLAGMVRRRRTTK